MTDQAVSQILQNISFITTSISYNSGFVVESRGSARMGRQGIEKYTKIIPRLKSITKIA